MSSKEEKRGDAYHLVMDVYRKSPGRSWRRLNAALHDALSAAITGHLSFLPDDFAAICSDARGGYWMGNSAGSVTGELYYMMAVKCGHTPACISFENYAERPAALWPESVKTPERLCIGKRLTWKGHLLDVSNMFREYFTACSYSRTQQEFGVGSTLYVDGERRAIERMSRTDKGMCLHLGAVTEGSDNRKPDKVVKIHYSELKQARKEADALRKAILSEIEEAQDNRSLESTYERFRNAPRGTYRHFDIEDIRNAATTKREQLKKTESDSDREQFALEQLERWRAGERVSVWGGSVCLRVSGNYIETSTGQSVTVESARKLFPLIPEFRHKSESISEQRIDTFDVRSVSPNGVKIGCTLVPWKEVERIAGELA